LIIMKIRNSVAIIAAASVSMAVLALTACNQSEPTAANADPKPNPAEQTVKDNPLGEGRAMTQAEIAEYLAMKKADTKAPEILHPDGQASLAKTAASTCVIDFAQSSVLAQYPDHGASTFIYGNYTQNCYNNANYWIRATPLNLDHFHLAPDDPTNWCFGSGNNWVRYSSSGVCSYQSDAMYWGRAASNMNGNSGIDFVAAANGYYRNFNLVAFYVRSGTVKVVANRVGIGWWVWYGNTQGNRWYWPANTTVSEAQFFDNAGNGVFTMDNLEVQIL